MNFAERMVRSQARHARRQFHLWPCSLLQKDYYERGAIVDLYDTPWDDKPRAVYFHSDACEDVYCRSGSFDYVNCDGCNRVVCEQNPANGWHIQFRSHSELGYVCLRCYETEILENGQPRSDFEGRQIKGGMFFSSDNQEPFRAGFETVNEFQMCLIQDAVDAGQYNKRALQLIDSGSKVITGFERLAFGGSEGYITMFSKAFGNVELTRRHD